MMPRVNDWPLVLAREVKAATARPFVWGEHDCCVWAARTVDAMTGSTIAARFAGTYDSKAGAARAIVAFGGTLEGAAERMAAECGFVEVPVLSAQRGDVVLAYVEFDGDLVPAIGICIGAQAAFAAERGLDRPSLRACARAWRV